MTKLKVCSKIHLFIIISVLFIAIGMAVGTICHFCANGFFNYGGEFAPYKSVVVNYTYTEHDDAEVKSLCEKEFGSIKAYEVSCSDGAGEVVYKFSYGADSAKLKTAVENINNKLTVNETNLNYARFVTANVNEGGARVIKFASIALAASAGFMFLYFAARYKLRGAFSALLACIHNLGIFVALAAVTRIPLGAEAIAVGAAVVFLTMIFNCILFDRTRKNFKNELYAKSARLDVVETSAQEVRAVGVYTFAALAVAAIVFGVFACISQLYIGALAPFGVVVLAMLACCYGATFFTPAVHGAIDALCEKVANRIPSKKKAAKAIKVAQPEEANEATKEA